MKKSPIYLSVVYRVLALIVVLSISGCLVDEDSTPTLKTRNTDELRIIQNGDYYEYIVSGRFTPSGGTTSLLEGTLNVTYTAESLVNPFTSGSGAAMAGNIFREYSTLNLGSGNVYTVKRYIQQNPLTGDLSIVAVKSGVDSPIGTLYRIGQNGVLSNPQPVEILTSPVPSTSADNKANFHYQYMSGCEGSSAPCAQVEQEINFSSVEYQGNADITTYDGRFNALRVQYTGNFIGLSAPLLFDMMGACEVDDAIFTQSDYIFPEVGVVFMDTTCSPIGGGGFFYTASLSNTNVPIP